MYSPASADERTRALIVIVVIFVFQVALLIAERIVKHREAREDSISRLVQDAHELACSIGDIYAKGAALEGEVALIKLLVTHTIKSAYTDGELDNKRSESLQYNNWAIQKFSDDYLDSLLRIIRRFEKHGIKESWIDAQAASGDEFTLTHLGEIGLVIRKMIREIEAMLALAGSASPPIVPVDAGHQPGVR